MHVTNLFEQHWLQPRIQLFLHILQENGGPVSDSVFEGSKESLLGQLDNLSSERIKGSGKKFRHHNVHNVFLLQLFVGG